LSSGSIGVSQNEPLQRLDCFSRFRYTEIMGIKEETWKAQVFETYFGTILFLYRPDIDNIDFVVMNKAEFSLLWAEVKRNATGIAKMFVQLILTIGKARTFENRMPPQWLAIFDNEKIAFLPYAAVSDIFYPK
jgi:hypothetical protein